MKVKIMKKHNMVNVVLDVNTIIPRNRDLLILS